jgi:small GTP-binding protein
VARCVKRVTIDGREVELWIWDIAGQEQFRVLAPLYARGASVAILTASITDDKSFAHLDEWVDILNAATKMTPPIVFAVNKCDLLDSAAITQDEIDEAYRDRFAGLFFVSAITDVEIDNLFMAAAELGYRFARPKHKHLNLVFYRFATFLEKHFIHSELCKLTNDR